MATLEAELIRKRPRETEDESGRVVGGQRQKTAGNGRRNTKKFSPPRPDWMEMYDRLVAYKEKYHTAKVPAKFPEDPQLGIWADNQRHRCKDKDRVALLNDIDFAWEAKNTDDYWTDMYERLVAYKEKYNTAKVPAKFPEDPQLGNWANNQRHRCKDKYRVALLNDIGFIWDNRNTDAAWTEMYDRLVAYKETYDTARVPFKFPDDPKLGIWVDNQRHRCKDKHRVSLLNDVGFVWDTTSDTAWKEMYDRLVAYKEKYHTVKVPFKFREDPQLGNWANNQRHRCKNRDRVALLNDIGFVWDPKWTDMYDRLVAYKEKYETTLVPISWKGDPKLGLWVSHQRTRCNRKERVDLLNNIGFVWDVADYTWMKMYHRLVAYKEKYETTCVPKKCEEDPQLGLWVRRQRQYCKDEKRVDLLEDIDFVWNTKPRKSE